jgi:uncharacterized protein YjiS (DUF1127 family)
MATIHRAVQIFEVAEVIPHVSAYFKRCWTALQERRKRARLRAALYALPDRHLRDIGVAWSESSTWH